MKAKSRINNLSRLAALAFVCFMIGFYLIDEVAWGFAFLGLGMALAIIDIIQKKGGDNPSRSNQQ
jgi:hypothetical protein